MVLGSARRTQIAVVTYPGLLPLELIGTVSTLDGLGLNTGFHPVTVAARRESLETDTPLRVVPQSTFAAVSHPAAPLVPSGTLMSTIGAMGDEQLLQYVRTAAETAELVASVGTGALILASAGLLTGRRATTHWAYRRLLENLGYIAPPASRRRPGQRGRLAHWHNRPPATCSNGWRYGRTRCSPSSTT